MSPLPRDSANSAYEKERDAASESSDTESSSDEESSDDETSDNESQNYANNPSYQNARDKAIMAEERWLYEILKNTRQQRNALKVEVLYYQGLKAALFAQHAAAYGEAEAKRVVEPIVVNEIDLNPIPEPQYPEMCPPLDECFAPNGPLTAKHQNILNRLKQLGEKQAAFPSNIEDFDIHEEQCNLEKLQNLTVEFEKMEAWDIEDPEYESEEEDEFSRVNMDMSMLVGHNDGD